MHYEALRFYLEVLIMVFTTLVNPFFTWWRTREKVVNNHISALERKIGAIEGQLTTVAGDVKHRPDCQYHQGFDLRLNQMNGSINKIEGLIEGRMEGIGNALDLIQEHLLSGGK